MEPINWFMTVVTQHYFDFNGRARRAEFWWYTLVYVIADVALYVIESILHVGTLLTSLYGLALLLPGLGVSVRRLHDTDRTGWLVLIPCVPGLLWSVLSFGALASGSLGGFLILTSLLGVATLLAAAYLVYLLAQPGTSGSNQYGTDPKAGLT